MVLEDVRLSLRLWAKQPFLTATAILTLSLGIGLTTAMFSIVYGTFLRGLPVQDAERILRVERNNLASGIEHMQVKTRDFIAWREQQTSFEGLAAWYAVSVNVSGVGGPAEPYNCAYGTANMFDLLKVEPVVGRNFRAEDEAPAAPPVVILSDTVWQQRYGGSPDVLGKTLKADGVEKTIIGVMPPGFRFPLNQFLWSPLQMESLPPGSDHFEVFGKLKPGIRKERALADLSAISARLAKELPESNRGVGVAVMPYVDGYVSRELRSSHYLMLGAVFGVLLIACANVGNLLLGRGLSRAQEMAIRMALGASRFRVAAQLILESFLFALAGGVLGLVLARWGIDLYAYSLGSDIPSFWVDVRIDSRVFLFTVGVTMLASLLAGLIPALEGARVAPNEILKDRSPRATSLRLGKLSTMLVVTEVALSCGLLILTALMVKSVLKLKGADLGFDPEKIVTAQLSLYGKRYPDEASRLRYRDGLRERLQGIPGVERIAFASGLPAMTPSTTRFGLERMAYAKDADYPETRWVAASPEYFAIFGLRLLAGRGFLSSDLADREPVVLVDQSFARRFFPGGSALGRRVRLVPSKADRPWATIVGVVRDLPMGGSDNDPKRETLYLPIAQKPRAWLNVIVQTRGSLPALTSRMRAEGAAIDPDIPIFAVQSMTQTLADVTRPYTRPSILFTVFGTLALALAAFGLYGVMAFSVSRRTQEIAIRSALGATPGEVQRMIVKDGFLRLAAGLLLGLVLAGWLARTLASLLFQVHAWDLGVFTSMPAFLLAIGLLACLLPAWRATRRQPLSSTLRAE